MARAPQVPSRHVTPLLALAFALVWACSSDSSDGDADRVGGAGRSGERAQQPSAAPVVATAAASLDGGADVVVARVEGLPIYASCVRAQAARAQAAPLPSEGERRQAAFEECLAFELLAQEAARRGLGTAPEVAEARTRAAVSALVEQEVERKIQTPADLPDSLTRRLLERNRWRLHRVEYRASFFVRFPVAKGEPREGPADRAARANAERVAQALAGERGLFAHHVRQRARELIGAATMEDGTVELSDPPRLVPAYSDALFALPELGRTSGAVRTDWGWDIILWTGVLPARDITPDELALELFPELRQMYFVAWSRSIGKSTKVEVFPEAFDRALGMTVPAKEPR